MKNEKAEWSVSRMRAKTIPIAMGISLAAIFVFAGGGFLLDLLLDKKPLFLIIGFVAAFIMTDLLIIIIGKKIWKR